MTKHKEVDITGLLDGGGGFGAFSDREILYANKRHDAKYGWSFQGVNLYCNLRRIAGYAPAPPGFDKEDGSTNEELSAQVWAWHTKV